MHVGRSWGFWVGTLTLLFIITISIEQVHSTKTPNRADGIRNLRRINRSKFPLRPEDGRRKSKRAGECRLGHTVHEIGDSWSPDLGEPFGIMYCIHCSCEPVQKKRKIVGRVRCRNIKSECPKLDCADAVTTPGQCCKLCPENRLSADNQTSDAIDDNDLNENNKEYAALLTPRSSSLIKSTTGLGEPMTTGLGAGRFMFLHRNLYYSFTHNEGLPRPKFVQFVDSDGNVVEEQEVTLNNYQRDTKKVCGVWKKIPRIYRKLLKEEKLFAALVTEKVAGDNDRFLAGRIAKQRYVANELYSALLESSTQSGTGGMGVLTVSASTGSIYLNLIFNGDFEEEREIGISVRIANAVGAGVEESVVLPKIQYETNNVEVRTILELEHLQSLARGTLFILLYSKRNPTFKLVGVIQSRTTCDIFDTILSSEDGSGSGVKGGVAWVFPLPDGSWSFNIQLPPEHSPVTSKLETGRRVLEELPLTLSRNMTRQVMTGISTRYFQLLYEENIYLSITTNLGVVRGKLTYRGFGDAQLSDTPLILQPPSGSTAPLRAEGILWIGVDNTCALNYQLTLSERPQSELMRLEVMETPALHMMGIPVQSYVLDDFEASEFEGEFHEIEKRNSFVNLNAGDALFKIVRVNDSTVLASTPLRHIRVPSSCLPPPRQELLDPYIIEPEDDSAPTPTPSKCFYDGTMRAEYSQWSPINDTCQICNCYKGRVTCDIVICPATDCVNPVLLTGECCRTCLRSDNSERNSGQSCEVPGDRSHPAGTSWHPYLPPDGFMACTTCTCKPDTLSVECVKETCPTLSCSTEAAFYPRPLACCKVCPVERDGSKDSLQDDGYLISRGPSESDILRDGGCKFRGELHLNGDEWNHRIEPFGYTPCIICSCRNGTSKCGRTRCPTLSCEVKVKADGECCAKCSTGGSDVSLSTFMRQVTTPTRTPTPTRKKPGPTKHRPKPTSAKHIIN